MSLQPLDPHAQQQRKTRNILQSVLLLGGMGLLVAFCSWIIAGQQGVILTLLIGGVSVAFGPQLPPQLLLRMYGARPLTPFQLPRVFQQLRRLSQRAELPAVPDLYYVPSSMLNAFAVGRPDQAAIAITDGLLRRLNLRELSGVLAHEVSHIRNNDIWVMGLADTVSRLTQMMSFVGTILLIVNLPYLLMSGEGVSWLLVWLLMLAPTIGSLLQFALSRTREFDADLDAAGLTEDPIGLASALEKIERAQGRLWETIFLPGRRVPDPSLLRTHPDTQERIRRLLSLRGQVPETTYGEPDRIVLPAGYRPITLQPRWRVSGLWY
jgi:heat shock protein HtpX